MDVMKSDTSVRGAIAPPKPKGASVSSPAAGTRSADELERDLREMLSVAQPNRSFDEPAADGSPRIPSLVSVWLISQVGRGVGTPKLVNLSKVDREELRSLGGVARLIYRALHSQPAVARAS